MDAPPDSPVLQQLRHRFLIEEPSRVTEWLWEEHGQTAAFLLNWMGDVTLLSAYLAPLPTLQQADILYRIASLDPSLPLSPLQEDILVESLRRISAYVREAGEEMIPDDPPPLRGERLYRAFLETLNEEESRNLAEQMAEVDPVLARLSAGLVPAQPSEDGASGGEGRTFHGLLNTYSDLLGHVLSSYHFGNTVVYPEAVEMVSAAGFAEDAPAQVIAFRVRHAGSESCLYLLISPGLFYHYLETAFGSAHPRFLQGGTKPELSAIEWRMARTLAQTLADKLAVAMGFDEEESAYRPEPIEPSDLPAELAGYGKTPLLSCQLTVKIGQSLAGKIGLLVPPSHLRELHDAEGGDLFEELIPRTPAPPPRRPALVTAGAGEAQDEAGDGPQAEEGSPEPLNAGAAEFAPIGGQADDPTVSLEDFLWRIELEEAENTGGPTAGRTPQPIDLLLQGHDPRQIASDAEGSREEKERLADLHYQYGSRFFQLGKYDEATEALDEALDANEKHEGAQLLLAAAWGEQGMYFKEILAYKKLIAERAALTEAQVLLARRLSFLGRADDAFQALESAIGLGFQPQDIVEADPCFKSLRRSVKWRQYLADITTPHPDPT